ncbi:hypothetical protein A3C94_00230 [Candidatus Kaiserbacteria bacterium RIFCSPHIGHO2_02_FULL_55_17]|uniref:Uncharacterized protein n=2 Tax=Candidatus Kaiseribacteriota TaxID=1752734 RepID=A0A1F6DRS9_9BACT|nr:MAG: hypothetical protein A3C94_00230 [Candidatus Kaiserbacteria bacterium RIFCSPHIGHO2_02_FULL_55_17]
MKEEMPNVRSVAEEETPVTSPAVVEKLDASNMNRENWNKLEGVYNAFLNGGGLHAMEELKLDGVISEGDFEAALRVNRAIVLSLNKYKDEALREAANKDNEEIERIKQRLADLQGNK